MQPLLGPCQCHIAQPALLLHFLRLSDGAHTGEDALLHAHHKDHREFQPLGGVHGHHDHRVLAGVMVVDVGVQGHLVQKALQRGLVLGVFHVAVDGGEQFLDVLQTGAAFDVVLGLEHIGVAGAGHHFLVKGGQLHGVGQLRQLAQHGSKQGQLARRLL